MANAFSETCQRNLIALPEEIRAYIPPRDSWALDAATRAEKMKRERVRRHRLATLLATGKDPAKKNATIWKPDVILEKRHAFKAGCAADPVFFIENCVWTRDPENKVRAGRILPLLVFDFARKHYFDPWLTALTNIEYRLCIRKSRRMLLSIYRMAWHVWRFRFVPNSHSWVSSDKENKVDKFNDWNSLLGKWRSIWHAAADHYPWMFPDLENHSPYNKLMNIRFPEWRDGAKRAIDEECWSNEMLGILPADPRSFAASDGFADEAAYIERLQELLFGAEDMTPDLCLGSTAPPDVQNLFWKRSELEGVRTETVPWIRNPLNLEGIRWDAQAEWRGPHTRRWRGKIYDDKLKTRPSAEIGREWDIDPMATAGAKVWANYLPERNCMPDDPQHPHWDLYERDRDTVVWYDVGRSDPWSMIWLQVKPDLGVVDVVDYWMRGDVTNHWWIPLLLGWPWSHRGRWLTKPEAMRWTDAVPWTYDQDEQEIIQRWHGRQRDVGGRPHWMYGDFIGGANTPTDLYTVEDRFHQYGLMCSSRPAQWRMEQLIEHANEVMLRIRISGFLVGKRPCGGRWPSIDECYAMWRRGERSKTQGHQATPIHDDYSHTGQATIFGAQWLPARVEARIMEDRKRVVIPRSDKQQFAQRGKAGWWS